MMKNRSFRFDVRRVIKFTYRACLGWLSNVVSSVCGVMNLNTHDTADVGLRRMLKPSIFLLGGALLGIVIGIGIYFSDADFVYSSGVPASAKLSERLFDQDFGALIGLTNRIGEDFPERERFHQWGVVPAPCECELPSAFGDLDTHEASYEAQCRTALFILSNGRLGAASTKAPPDTFNRKVASALKGIWSRVTALTHCYDELFYLLYLWAKFGVNAKDACSYDVWEHRLLQGRTSLSDARSSL